MLEERGSTTNLRLAQTSEDRTYLNQIAKEWRDCSQVLRTNLQLEQIVVLHLEGPGTGGFDLTVPDLSGEAFEQQLTDRRMATHHDEFLQQATGLILFVHPDVHKPTQLTQAIHLEAEIRGTDDTGGSDGSPIVSWSIEKLPTQVKLVELLQFILERVQHRVRVAIVVSAWDLVDRLGAPDEFLSHELPLLRQFLDANDDLLEHAVFGVSAQGGDITDPRAKQVLLELDDALNRIRVSHALVTNNDITRPIAWLLGDK